MQWTTDEDLTEAIRSIGISDVLEIKFFENRANGQSKGWVLFLTHVEYTEKITAFIKLSNFLLQYEVYLALSFHKSAVLAEVNF